MINFTNCIYQVPNAPTELEGCLRSCQGTVHSACKEFITQTAADHGFRWRREAKRFLSMLRERPVYDRLNSVLLDLNVPGPERLTTVRSLARLQARDFLTRPDDPADQTVEEPKSWALQILGGLFLAPARGRASFRSQSDQTPGCAGWQAAMPSVRPRPAAASFGRAPPRAPGPPRLVCLSPPGR